MTGSPVIRSAGIPDLPGILGLRIDFERITRDSGSWDEDWRRAELEALLGPDLAGGRLRCWIAEVGGEVVAQAALRLLDPPPHAGGRSGIGSEGEILNVYTAPAFRGRGLGSALVGFTVAEAESLGLSVLRLQATEDSRRIYERAGFREVGREMVLRLPPPGR